MKFNMLSTGKVLIMGAMILYSQTYYYSEYGAPYSL